MSRCGTQFADGATGGDRPQFAVSIDLIKSRANSKVREIAAELLPNGREECGYWRTGSIADEPGQSLAVTLRGPDQGMWCDHSCRGTAQGGGDIIQLVEMAAFRGNRGEAIAWLKSRLGLDGLDPGRLRKMQAEAAEAREKNDREAAATAEDKRRKALGLFLRGQPIKDTPVELYLATRGISLEALGRVPNALAFHAEVWNVEAGRKLPCMLAAIVRQGRHIATHRTWIAPDGKGGWTKADLEEPKKVLGSFKGGHIPLTRARAARRSRRSTPASTCGRREGIEDGLSVAVARPQLRVVAGVTLGNLGELVLPDQVGRLVIIGQRDTKPKTLEALERAIGAQQERGREVWLTPPPAGGFKDVNEALQAEIAA
jgi:hypothetical protein